MWCYFNNSLLSPTARWAVFVQSEKGEKMKKLYLILFLGFILAGCTTAGPFVTNISQNKNGTLSIEKCQVEHNAFTGAITTVNCVSSQV